MVEADAQVGFGSRAYFSRIFTRHTGLSPAAYRRMIRYGGKKRGE